MEFNTSPTLKLKLIQTSRGAKNQLEILEKAKDRRFKIKYSTLKNVSEKPPKGFFNHRVQYFYLESSENKVRFYPVKINLKVN